MKRFLSEYFAGVEDSRVQGRCHHLLSDILLTGLCTYITGGVDFQELVSKSNIQDKELFLRVLSMYSDPEQREREIKNISSVYKTLADEILPQLRRSRLT
ncbi:hypothetical protein EZS27_041494, partial [termite gut metagenome]